MPISIAGSFGFIVTGLSQELPTSGIGYINLNALITLGIATVIFAPIGAKVTHVSR